MTLPPLRNNVPATAAVDTNNHMERLPTLYDERATPRVSALTPLKAAERLPTQSTLSPSKGHGNAMSQSVQGTTMTKLWHRCNMCHKSFEREESLAEHLTRHKNQMRKRQQRMQEDQAAVERATKARRTLNTTCAKTSPAVRLKFIL
ncbi:hypothetical protein DYB25_000393 [Aphanomyces astaci]|uniref:C2H2-type domain-containing protein n=1 Tax=Aphanomyces astaci TaxID=112090 RepID=A0A397FFD1_APHAT|nr:hypothetical protein DYB36_007990 [Aphanomyces astaci]RHY22815.1 hypothetical protein DYB25_000393 [Aphanomyces astaci]RHY46258.1 hypothetical protein DYB38_014368 [Aphanomyces astaci]RHY64097.1 hypothetical protein DYB34_000732 [Aphanomyces astaci]RHZ24304.1 hypothetical protein DYB31_003416 [Aphanomyces astaci]